MVMFGGWDMPAVFSDLHILDLTFVEWSQPKVNGRGPSPRRCVCLSAQHGRNLSHPYLCFFYVMLVGSVNVARDFQIAALCFVCANLATE